MAGDATHMRVVINFDREPDPKWFLLRGPHRLVIDLPKTKFAIDPKELKARGLIKNVRYGHINEGTSRLILDGEGTVRRRQARRAAKRGRRLATAWSPTCRRRPQSEFDAALAVQAQTTGSTQATPKSERLGLRTGRDGQRFTIVIDPGHGGIDGGARGPERHGREGHHADLCRRNCATSCAPTAATTCS